MAQVIVNLTRVQVFENEEFANVNVVFNEEIDGIERKIDASGAVDYVPAKVKYVSIPRNALTSMLCEANQDIDDYRSSIGHAFGQKEFGIILVKGTVLTMERELHPAGEVYGQSEDGTDLAYYRDSYTTQVVDVRLTDRAKARLEKALEL